MKPFLREDRLTYFLERYVLGLVSIRSGPFLRRRAKWAVSRDREDFHYKIKFTGKIGERFYEEEDEFTCEMILRKDFESLDLYGCENSNKEKQSVFMEGDSWEDDSHFYRFFLSRIDMFQWDNGNKDRVLKLRPKDNSSGPRVYLQESIFIKYLEEFYMLKSITRININILKEMDYSELPQGVLNYFALEISGWDAEGWSEITCTLVVYEETLTTGEVVLQDCSENSYELMLGAPKVYC